MPKQIEPVGKALNAWTDWFDPTLDHRQPVGQIVYEVRATSGGLPVKIKRASGDDSDGLLYIGETNIREKAKNKSRYRLLVRSFANPNRKTKHEAADKYFARQMAVSFPLNGIQVRYVQLTKPFTDVLDVFTTPDGKDPVTTRERGELDTYSYRFGELPPLNDIRGKKAQGGRPTPKSPKSAGKHIRMQ